MWVNQLAWRHAEDYEFTQQLSREQWAWEFLRRNPEYQTDWLWFEATWSALEQDYGKPPQRDFNHWKQDSRAYRYENDDDNAERLMIECWMGQRWGFYKFPLSPVVDQPTAEQLTWRDEPVEVSILDEQALKDTDNPGQLALAFDLTAALKPQLEQARRLLALMQRQLKPELNRQHLLYDPVYWSRCLRLLDAETEGVTVMDAAKVLVAGTTEQNDAAADYLIRTAHRLMSSGYRSIPIKI